VDAQIPEAKGAPWPMLTSLQHLLLEEVWSLALPSTCKSETGDKNLEEESRLENPTFIKSTPCHKVLKKRANQENQGGVASRGTFPLRVRWRWPASMGLYTEFSVFTQPYDTKLKILLQSDPDFVEA
jgi:hypothetical protein